MAKQKFGSTHTDLKLQKLSAYLGAFNTALKNQPFERVYIDAFAGTGEIETAESDLPLVDGAEVDAFIDGSVRRALAIEPPFNKYVFIERDAAKAEQLRALVAQYPSRKCEVLVGDANEKVGEIVRATNWSRARAVAFLDPFGSQVTWQTLELLGSTKAVDLWYLFPSGLSVLRQISRAGHVLPEHRPALERMFGPNDWESMLIKRAESQELFGNTDMRLVHRASADQITRFMIECMGNIFEGGVHQKWLPLGSRNIHMYSLIFACANPRERASKLAHKLAGAVLSSQKTNKEK
jgi:three-Cys-motif partner protein